MQLPPSPHTWHRLTLICFNMLDLTEGIRRQASLTSPEQRGGRHQQTHKRTEYALM